ncbi:ribonuclease H-like protein [Aspergillus niger CBS 101883]|uniref:ribonuclease H n=2 Tax=Aspergillus niger TaxID=5061 RepID=A2Q7X4_ASPNC|nr:ribonuclease H-like protein [Aspergillus niger CBS 101883]XP_059603108.1 uncharacterized protein An01g02270 [Aspergillus niger]PYH51417.1 ribonuclease H-like protein [Aspergillus niger CBS 101883]CAK43597.1 unnamed protein product [Aspergillus niger]
MDAIYVIVAVPEVMSLSLFGNTLNGISTSTNRPNLLVMPIPPTILVDHPGTMESEMLEPDEIVVGKRERPNLPPPPTYPSPPWFTSSRFTLTVAVEPNGQPGSIGAAAAAFKDASGRFHGETTEDLPSYTAPTNQRAEITSVILGLRMALKRYDQLHSDPWLDVTIYSDSAFAVDCMEEWVYKWIRNGWMNCKGNEVANRDLIEEAVVLSDRLKEKGDVRYVWIPREENQLCNDLKNARCDEQSSSSDDSY